MIKLYKKLIQLKIKINGVSDFIKMVEINDFTYDIFNVKHQNYNIIGPISLGEV